jgi:spore coat protein CotF
MLLQDQQNHEKICIQKYSNYANQAQDTQLKQLFTSLEQQEQQHLNTINQVLSGQVPNMSSQQQSPQNSTQSQASSQTTSSSTQGATANQSDASLCTDMLMTEKYVSGAYDTAIFEFTDTNVRQALNHIQKEEQQHGESIYQYMQSNGMYNVQ